VGRDQAVEGQAAQNGIHRQLLSFEGRAAHLLVSATTLRARVFLPARPALERVVVVLGVSGASLRPEILRPCRERCRVPVQGERRDA
jgi:tRNA G18 (ribose-2'-O)-methylase SpoU